MGDRLLDRMKQGITDRAPTSELLRQCVLLGGEAGSASLRDWARRELDGYLGVDELPSYRRISGVLMLDGAKGYTLISNQPVSPHQLDIPEIMKESLRGPVEMHQPLAELEQLANEPMIKMTPPGMTEIVMVANRRMDETGEAITCLYWMLTPAVIASVIDRVRTQLAALVAELLAVTPNDQTTPSPANAEQAVQVVILGNHRGPVVQQNIQLPTEAPPTSWQRVVAYVRASWGWLVGMTTVLSLYVATAAWQGWKWPWP